MPRAPTVEFESLDLADFDNASRYKFLTAAVVPRPIALVTSLADDGRVNVAPFSQFVILSSAPAILGFVSSHHPDGIKDTQIHAVARGEFVIHVVDDTMAELTQRCAFPFPTAVSEAEHLGLDTCPCEIVAVPRLTVAPLAFECRLLRTEAFGQFSTLIAGEVVRVHARKGLRQGHRIDHHALRPLGRISGRRYCRTADTLEMGPEVDASFSTTPARLMGKERT
jgi:flavin reductase (DIM6/NTAB) family NADH-FMN oxidoreductase RutF